MEWLLIILVITLLMFLSSSDRWKELRFRYAWFIFFVGYPVFFYLVVLKDFSWFKLGLFVLMLGGSIHQHYTYKSRIELADAGSRA
jgi:hypothetical protein